MHIVAENVKVDETSSHVHMVVVDMAGGRWDLEVVDIVDMAVGASDCGSRDCSHRDSCKVHEDKWHGWAEIADIAGGGHSGCYGCSSDEKHCMLAPALVYEPHAALQAAYRRRYSGRGQERDGACDCARRALT